MARNAWAAQGARDEWFAGCSASGALTLRKDLGALSPMHHATFVLSTGRCGTQWLAHEMARVAGPVLRVEHEPLRNDYAPRRMLGADGLAGVGGRSAERILQHVEGIERTLETRDYFEAGHPCWSSIPWLARRFAGRMRVVHLVRHPVPTACSWVSHGAFVPPLLPHLAAKELIAPTDAGATLSEYGATWAALTPFEKCLLYWAEVNGLGLKLERAGEVPWLRVRYEDLFDPASMALAQLGDFLGLPPGAAGALDRREQVDRYRYALAEWPEVASVARHPRVMALAEELGYGAENFRADGLAKRFLVRPPGV